MDSLVKVGKATVSEQRPIYRIAQWEELYENAQSRKVDRLRWVPMPNHHDGKGFRRLMMTPNAMEIYGAWALIVQVASKCPTRGVLLDADGPLLAEELSLKTGGSQKIFEKALQVLSSQRIAWLLVDGSQTATTPLPDATTRAGLNGMEGIEGKEGNGTPPSGDDAFPVSLQTEKFLAAWEDWKRHRSEIRRPLKPTQIKQQIKTLASLGHDEAIATIEHTIEKGWIGLVTPDGVKAKQAAASRVPTAEDHAVWTPFGGSD
jgi:hypothetical protein